MLRNFRGSDLIYFCFEFSFEWNMGFTPKFGLVAVNLETQERTIKPSARMLGDVARRGAL